MMFDLIDPLGMVFVLIALLSMIVAVVYGRGGD
jgi:hypothetical protein